MDARTHDDDSLLEFADAYLRNHPPTLADVLGAVCETYCVDPSEILVPRSWNARRAYCYLAMRWAGDPLDKIGSFIEIPGPTVNTLVSTVSKRIPDVLRDDFDLIGIRIAERVAMRGRAHK